MLQSIIRYLILSVISWGAGKGLFKSDSFSDTQISQWVNDAVFVVGLIGTVFWSWLQKKKAEIKPVSTIQFPPNVN